MANWDKRWMQLCDLAASWSKDRNTKVGSCIVDNRKVLISIGWNGFPRKINDNIDSRHLRPAKYSWTEHSERNAIFNAAAKGISTLNCTMYVNWFPCADCARGIIQAGIIELVAIEPDWEDERWGEDFRIVKEMLEEAGIIVRFIVR